jgi:phosphatidylethanolamine/phosphatidyl-N-methylethanolamine N-methyltransferase
MMDASPPRGESARDAILDEWYQKFYSDVAASADGSFMARYMHRALESRRDQTENFPRVLEVGANRGEHVAFVRHRFDEYFLTDIRTPQVPAQLLEDTRIKTAISDVTDLPYADFAFDRVISTCVLHHVDSPLQAALEMRRVTKSGGVVSLLIPTDPGLAYRLGKALTSGRAARRRGIGPLHDLVGALDHPNHFRSIRTQLMHAFRDDLPQIDWFPWRLPGVDTNAFVVFHVRVDHTR